MKTATKVLIIVAVALVVLGIAGTVTSVYFLGEEIFKSATGEKKIETVTVNEEFDSISVVADGADVELKKSDDGGCRAVFTNISDPEFSAAVADGVLKVGAKDGRKWYERIRLFWGKEQKIEIYLPKESYSRLNIDAATGDVKTARELSFETVNIDASTGSVSFPSAVNGLLKIKLSTGDIKIDGVNTGSLDLTASTGDVTLNKVGCEGDVKIRLSTGSVLASDVTCKNLVSTGSTGDVILKNVISLAAFDLKRSTGDILFDGCDAAEITLKTSTGDVTGTLLSEKIFFTETSTGDVRVPKSLTGGKCEIKTSTGDIILGIKDKTE